MKLFLFEWQKIWRQKKLIWLTIIILLCTTAIFLQNVSEQGMRSNRAAEKVDTYIGEISRIRVELDQLKRVSQLDDRQEKQLATLSDLGSTLTLWKVAANNEQWEAIPPYEQTFWKLVEELEQNGGFFTTVQGVEREKAVQKNEWMVTNELAYDDEAFPLSPALTLKQSSEWLFSLLGVFILLLFFGTTITAEKEQNTWLTLKTQPIPKWQRYSSKFISLLVVLLLFLLIVICFGLLVPLIAGDYSLNLSYPQLIENGDQFVIISTFSYLKIGAIHFISAVLFTFSLITLFSVWLRSSFSCVMLVSATIFIGFVLTDGNAFLQHPANPFQFYNMQELLMNPLEKDAYLYLLSSLIWSSLLFVLVLLFREKDIGLWQGKEIEKPFAEGRTERKQSHLWNIIVFEWRKIYRKGLLQQVWILLLLFMAFGYFLIFQEAYEKKASYLSNLENIRENHFLLPHLQENLASFERMAEGKEEMEKPNMVIDWQIEETKKTIALFEEQLEKGERAFSAYEEGNWIPFYEYQLFENRFMNKEFDTEFFINNRIDYIGKMSVDASLVEKEWLMEHHIQPVFAGEFVTTIFHNWGEGQAAEQGEWEEANRKVDSSALFTLYLYFQQHVYFIPVILFLLLLGGGLAAEKGKTPSIRLLLTQPLTLRQLFQGKWLTSVAIALVSCLAMFVIVLLTSTIFDRFGDWNYPVLVYDSVGAAYAPNYSGYFSQGMGFHFIPLGNYLLQSIMLFLLLVVFLMTLTHFCAVFMKHAFTVFAFVTLLVAAGYALSTKVLIESAHLVPFTYLNVSRITNGELSAVLNNEGITYLTGSLVLLVSTVLIMSAGNLLLMKGRSKLNLKKSSGKEMAG